MYPRDTPTENDPTDDDNTAAEDNNDGNNDPNEDNGGNNQEDAQDIYDELLEQCYPSDYLWAHSDELDYCGTYPQQNDEEYSDYSEDSDDNVDNHQPEVNGSEEYNQWAQGVNIAVVRQSLPFPYIFAHMADPVHQAIPAVLRIVLRMMA